jgi:spermidine/putrescine transport system substrate-binding protein
MAQKNLLEPINKAKLKNYKNLDPIIMEKSRSFDPENKFSIPYFWGTTGLIYNKKQVPDKVINDHSWNMIANPAFRDKQKITMLDDAREVIGAALIAAGFNPNDVSERALQTAAEVLKSWDANISQYDSDSYKNEIQDGTTWLAQSYNGDALQIMQSNPDVGFVLPKEGATLWIDSIVIPKYAEHKDLAYKFIDFILEAENGKINAEYVQYATPNAASLNLLPDDVKNNPLIYPNPAYLSLCTMIQNIGENVLTVDKLWQEIRK